MRAATGFLLLSQKVNSVERLLLLVLILGIPTQLGRHFWPESSYVTGIRVDYLSPTLYATDILIFLIFILEVIKFSVFNFPHFVLPIGNSRGKQFSILVFASFLLIGVFISKSPLNGFYGLVKLLEFAFFGFYVAKNTQELKLEKILLMFSIGIIFESFLSIFQYFNHGSINGIFYFFGERFFNSQTPAIANVQLGGELFLRPYGTFPHPNVLAGYLVVGMSLIIFNWKRVFYCLPLLIGTAALFLTLSRVAIILWFVIFGIFLAKRFLNLKSYLLIIFLIGLLLLGLTTPLGTRFTRIKLTDESIAHRERLIRNSIAMIKDNPIFGVGLNNFLVNLPLYQKSNISFLYLQPVHNIFLLVASETGLMVFGFFVWFLFATYRRIKKSMAHSLLFITLSCTMVLGMFDHYFLTLQQGQLLFSFILGLCWSFSQFPASIISQEKFSHTYWVKNFFRKLNLE